MKILTTVALLVSASVMFAQTLPFNMADFEAYGGAANGTVLFQAPSFSGSTSALRDTAGPNISQVTSTFPAGNLNAGLEAMNVQFAFTTGTGNRWIRLTTFNTTVALANPVISFEHPFSFDVYTTEPLQISLLLRETNPTGLYGSNGGTANGIEFVGGTASTGKAVPANQWVTLYFDVPNESVTAFAGATANGILETTTGKGVLEALALIGTPGTTYDIYFDNFTIIPEPSTLALGVLGGFAVLFGMRRRK
jgi:hypothetical protein